MKTIISVLTIIAMVFAAFFVLENRHASSAETEKKFEKLDRRLEFKITTDQLFELNRELRQTRRDCGRDLRYCDDEQKEEYDELVEQKEELVDKKKELIKKNIK